MTIRVNYGVVCEDIRREDSGKFMLIGVFGRDIRATAMPATLVLAVLANVTTDAAYSGEIEYRCLIAGKVGTAETKGKLVVNEPGNSVIAFPGLPITISTPSDLEFQFRATEEDWQSIVTIPVVDATPTV